MLTFAHPHTPQVGDKIKYIKCIKGSENLLNGFKSG